MFCNYGVLFPFKTLSWIWCSLFSDNILHFYNIGINPQTIFNITLQFYINAITLYTAFMNFYWTIKSHSLWDSFMSTYVSILLIFHTLQGSIRICYHLWVFLKVALKLYEMFASTTFQEAFIFVYLGLIRKRPSCPSTLVQQAAVLGITWGLLQQKRFSVA